jgi:glucokinase
MDIAIGIDLGGTNVKGILLNEHGDILEQRYMPTSDDASGKWKDNVREMVKQLTDVCPGEVSVIGLSCPGLANENNKCIRHLPNRLLGLENYVWEEAFLRKTFVINDAHAALIAESKFGTAQGYRNAVLITLGTGVGGGILINGELYQGNSQMAGHFGHVSINSYDDERSIIGMPGSLEYAVGNYSVARRSLGRFKTTFELVQAYRESDVLATWLWLDAMRKLALTVVSFINTLSPEIVVLSGGITQAGDALLTPLQQFIDLYEYKPHGTKTPVVLAKFGDMAGAIGAAAFAFGKM